MQIEAFATQPLQQVVPSYLYNEYSDDDDLQAFVASQNAIAQGYLDWFSNNPLGLYVSPTVSGGLLDWIGQGVYNIQRPVLASNSSMTLAGYNSAPYNTIDNNDFQVLSSGTSSIASDDIYKRTLTWNLYRGDGQQFCLQWLKNRVSRFVNGANGSDYPVLDDPPSITVSGTVFTVANFATPQFTALQLLYQNNELAFPFQYTMAFVNVAFINDGGILQLTYPLDYPTSSTSLAAGSVWYNGGTVSVVPGVTPDPLAPPLYFSTTTPTELLDLGGGNLPTSNPSNTGQLWNNGGLVSIS